MANGQNAVAANAGQVEPRQPSARPRIVLLHYSAPPIVGGVEAVIAEPARLFGEAGFRVLLVVGRRDRTHESPLQKIAVIPEMDSENPEYLILKTFLDAGGNTTDV